MQHFDDRRDELLGIARFTFVDGGAAEFKRLSARCMEIVRTKDSGTLQYDIYLDDDETGAVVIERYRDSAALVEHLANIGDDLMQAILATATSVEGETLGRPSDDLRARMAEGPVRLFVPYASM
ncbi:antibiotic biosynthesis monooxygenase [Nocardioides sp. ChNu-153]|uniref:putative quinol monooxygenase n=1 Tax=unclassified Nocardioides TaxID=2615069 RepID=UPI0024062414|nr:MULTISPECIES: antibiotic biosynthesis monooxygenase [unclassified Nocardioides]MDF9716090.1 antibiotic biosynthesis monooxygenase [Nocardioides sp. ChNu-99]MDN7120365.1 antibiotic biosynthesis monooxygenase [Nocardioides sp. ChNu-153]